MSALLNSAVEGKGACFDQERSANEGPFMRCDHPCMTQDGLLNSPRNCYRSRG